MVKRSHEWSTTADYHQGFFPPLTRFSLRLRSKPQVFRKYSHALGPDALDFLEDALDKHEIRDEDVEYSVDLIAKEYNKQDGWLWSYDVSASYLTLLPLDAVMKVSVTVLQRVYQLLQGSSTAASSIEQDILDVDAHVFVVNAFEIPQWNWSSERSTFEQ